jgi:maleylacetoacetate isomerase
MPETILYDYWRSSASYRVRIALNIAGIDYTTKSVDLVSGEQRSDRYLATNPQGLVPTLEIDGERLTQSLAILEYLNTTRNLNLLPKDPAARAKVRAIAHAIAVDIHPVCNLRVVSYAAGLSDTPGIARTEWMHQIIRPGLAAVDTMLAEFDQSPYCCGDAPCLVDICLIPQIYNAHRWGVDISDLPRILAVESACDDAPAFVAAHPENCVQP